MKKSAYILMTVLIAASCASGNKESAKDSVEKTAVKTVTNPVVTEKVVLETIANEGNYSTTIQANAINNIAPLTTGRIRQINVEIGDFVKEGQILAEMDRTNLEQAEIKYNNAKDEIERVRQLYEQGGVSKSDFEAQELNYKVSKTTYENTLENTILRSPISGVVTARNYDKGDLFSMSSPIFTVQQIVPVKFYAAVSEADYTKVKKGNSVKVSVDALPGETFTGKVVRIYPIMDASTHTFNVEVQVSNENRLLRPGMYAKAVIDFGGKPGVTVSDAAVVKMQGSGQRSVFVLDRATMRVSEKVVTLGKHFDGKYEILSGLSEGDEIVVKGHTVLRDGSLVEIVEK